MKDSTRIPKLADNTFDGMLMWFAELSKRDMLFHPDDPAAEIFNIATGQRTFTNEEAKEIDQTLIALFDHHGDGVYDAAHPIFMKACGIPLDA